MKHQLGSLKPIVAAVSCIVLLTACAQNKELKQAAQFSPSALIAVDQAALAAQLQHADRYAAVIDDNGNQNAAHGAYQLALNDDGSALYVAVAGVVKHKGTGEPQANRMPGAVFKLNPDSLALEKEIPLPYQAHALAVQANRVIVTHTRAAAFSFIDDDVLTATFNPDTVVKGDKYRARHVQFGANGDFFINYYVRGLSSAIMKYNRDGNHDANFVVNPFDGMALAMLVDADQVYTGKDHVKSVNAATGSIKLLTKPVGAIKISEESKTFVGADFYGFTKIAAGKIVGLQFSKDGLLPNLYFFDIPNQTINSTRTGTNALEADYINGNLIATSSYYDKAADGSPSANIMLLPLSQELQFAPNNFINIKMLDGIPTNMTVRQSADGGSDIFVSLKRGTIVDGQHISKIHLSKDFTVLNGQAVGECKVTSVNVAELIKPEPKFIEQNQDCQFIKL